MPGTFVFLCGAACGSDDGSSDDAAAGTGTAASAPADDGGDGADLTGSPANNCEFSESFDDVPDGAEWPAPFVRSGGVEIADVQGGRARLRPSTSEYSLARMFAPMDCTDFEATVTFEFTSGDTQGAGLYVRHNGGYLAQTDPAGEGYAAFAEAFRDPVGFGLWREVSGSEENLEPVLPTSLEAGVVYAMRLRVTQTDAGTTVLQGRIWPADAAEPTEWQIERSEATESLQGVSGGLALDAWSVLQSGTASDMFFDDVVVTQAR